MKRQSNNKTLSKTNDSTKSHPFTTTNTTTPSSITSEYIQEITKLRLPRCTICSTDWYDKKSKTTNHNNAMATMTKNHNDMHEDGGTSSSSSHSSTNCTIMNQLILLPACDCTHLKMVSHSPFVSSSSSSSSSSTIENDFFRAYQQALSLFHPVQQQQQQQDKEEDTNTLSLANILQQTLEDICSSSSCLSLRDISLSPSPINTLSHNTMCRVCLQSFLEASQQVEKQEETCAVFTTQLQCPKCRHKYSPRTLTNLLNKKEHYHHNYDNKNNNNKTSSYIKMTLVPHGMQQKQKQQHSSSSSSIPHTLSFTHYLKCTIQTIRFWKCIRKITLEHYYSHQQHHHQQYDSMNTLIYSSILKRQVEGKVGEEDDNHSSDSCFSSFEDNDDEDNEEKKDIQTHRQRILRSHNHGMTMNQSSSTTNKSHYHHRRHHVEMKPGELRQELLNKDLKFRQEVENEQLLRSMPCEELGIISKMTYGEYLRMEKQKEQEQGEDSRIIQNLEGNNNYSRNIKRKTRTHNNNNSTITTSRKEDKISSMATSLLLSLDDQSTAKLQYHDVDNDDDHYHHHHHHHPPSIQTYKATQDVIDKTMNQSSVEKSSTYHYHNHPKSKTMLTITPPLPPPRLIDSINKEIIVGNTNHSNTKRTYTQTKLSTLEREKKESSSTSSTNKYPTTSIASSEITETNELNSSSTDIFSESESLQIMLSMGFPELHSKMILRDANYNIELAVTMIMSLEQESSASSKKSK